MPGLLPRAKAPWPERRRRALADPIMRGAVLRYARTLAQGKTVAYATYPRGEAMRVEAVLARRRALGHIDELLDEFTANVEANGGHVARAAGPADVGRYVLAISGRRGAGRVVKSKSMATEEIALNEQLEAAGLSVRETDLGEYIIQLADERPSHILAPAAHKTRDQVQVLFEREAARSGALPPGGDATPQLTAFARRQLREDFLASDIGITGGNYIVAETGTLVLITNEGNGRLTTSVPAVHVAVVGIEKVVATWDELAVLLQQAPMSGTGQLVSTYVSFVTGPRRPGELDGPEEFHVVLLDNGRHELLGTPYEEVLACIRCGACLNVCPVFRNIGGQAYGSIYSGPIGVVLTPLLGGLEKAPELPKSACALCHACRVACPMEIDLPRHILALRRTEIEAAMEPRMVRLTFGLWGRFWASPAGYRLTARLARLGQPVFMRKGKLTRAPGLIGGWTATRDAPPVARETFHEWWRRRGRRGKQA
jgi:L-lactate dehydrogenase complex protein LldF